MYHVLIADSNKEVRQSAKIYLTGYFRGGVRIGEATTCQDAIDYIKNKSPDSVLMGDIPRGTDSIKATKEIRESSKGVPIILWSIEDLPESEVCSGDIQATRSLGKATPTHRLCTVIEECMKDKQ